MSKGPSGQERFAATPMSGILGALIGVGILSLYFKSRTFDSSVLKSAQFGLGIAMLVWGLKTAVFAKRSPPDSPKWNRWNPYHANFTREGLVYLAIMMTVFVGALLGRSNLLLLVFGLLAGPFVVNGYVTLTMLQAVGLRRLVPERVMVGERFWVEVELANKRRWLSSWMMIVSDRLQNARETLRPRLLFARVSPGMQVNLSYQVRLMTRGEYDFGPLRIATRFPLGLVDRALVIDVRDRILVHPRIGRLTSRWRREERNADELVQQARPRPGAFDDDFHRLREYRSGDNPRAIHWRTSARRNELIVREYQQSRDRDMAVLLDLWIPRTVTTSDVDRVELAVSFAATLCVDYCRSHRDSKLLLGISGEKQIPTLSSAGPLFVESLLDELALIQPDTAQNPERFASDPFLVNNPGIRAVLVTTRKLVGGTTPALEALQSELLRRGTRVQTVEADPATLGQFFIWDV